MSEDPPVQAATRDTVRRVVLIIETSRSFGRGCLTGIAAYVRSHGPWSIYQHERSSNAEVPAEVRDWRPHGVIARIETDRVAEFVAGLQVPAVDLRCRYHINGVARLTVASESCVAQALEHFASRGFTRFAFCGYAGIDFSEDRATFFEAASRARGIRPVMYTPRVGHKDVNTLEVENEGDAELQALANWLDGLPKPIAIMACNDVRGRQLLTAAGMAGIEVPTDVAVLGVDDDEVLCELSMPPLSSVSPNARHVGYEAAALLDDMMAGAPMPTGIQFLPSGPVRVRRSSDVIAVDDLIVSRAMSFIRDHACTAITTETVAGQVGVSRATLDRRFAKHVGRSPSDEIFRVRIARTKQLLEDTNYDMTRISEMVGFNSASHLAVAFKRSVRMTLGEYRRTTRSPS
ncbi:MAG: DNA-binding transcriptional regulator [Planctomycetota bacterium]